MMINYSPEGRRRKILLLATASIGAVAMVAPGTALAQDADAPAASNQILVTARRSAEDVQDVPVTVQVVTGERLDQLAITTADELGKLAPGLTLVNNNANTQVSLRGVAWRPGSGTPATPIYYNEVPFDPGQTIVSIFDVEQIEVLRGPQGTSRGAPSISGAVTIATRAPDLNEFGGFAQVRYGSGGHLGLQAGINFPIAEDVFAIRLATNIDNSDFNRVYSVNSAIQPELNDRSFRATALFEPTDTISVQAMYQRRSSDKLLFTQVVGAGSPGAPAANATLCTFGLGLCAIPANFNGPALTVRDRASVQDAPARFDERVDLLTVNASWDIFGQTLSYNFGRQYNNSPASFSSVDQLNMIPGFEAYTSPSNLSNHWASNEIRLSGESVGGSPIDYDIGWFSKHSNGLILFDAPSYLAGAFGSPTSLPGVVRTPNPAYILNSSTRIGIGQVFDSFYGNLTFHISDRTELRGGIAFLRDRVPVTLNVTVANGLSNAGFFNVLQGAFSNPQSPFGVANPNSPYFGLPVPTTCAGIGAYFRQNFINSASYPGVCDAVVSGAANTPPSQNNNDIYHKAIYNFQLSHRFTDDLMVYATTGTSFRTGLPAINNPGLPAALTTPLPESATSYELGFKSTLNDRLQFNADVFQINYGNQLTTFEGVRYWNVVAGRVATTSLAFYRNIDSRVRGFEVELAAEPVENLTLGANIGYSRITSRGGSVPCNDAAQAAISASNPINFCNSPAGQVLNQDSPWSIVLDGGYTVPMDTVDAYLRFNLSHRGRNPNFGNFATAGVSRSTPSYNIVDLFAGVTGQDSVWELGFYAKNVFNTQAELTRTNVLNNVYAPYAIAPSGYNTITTTTPREVGVSLRFAFGSH